MLWRALWIFVLIAGGITLVFQQLTAVYEQERIANIAEREYQHLDALNRTIQQELFETIEDMATLTELPTLTRYLDNFDEEQCRVLERYLETVSRNYRRYDQIRLLDLEGHERVRINHERGMVYSVMKRELQDKSQRYYFKAARALQLGEAYLSRLDLNVENGVLEVPYKPMLRLIMPAADSQGQIKGYVVFNYRGRVLVDTVRRLGSEEGQREVYFLNRNGYYLSHPSSDKEWGFMLGRAEDNFSREQPAIWQAVLAQKQNPLHTDEGLFIYRHINPLGSEYAENLQENVRFMRRGTHKDPETLHWMVVLHIPNEQLYLHSFMHHAVGWVSNVIVYALIMALSWLLAHESLKRKQMKIYERRHVEELAVRANTDYLTGLYNHRYFYEEAKRELNRSARHKQTLSVIMLDIDHFKSINELHGHDIGDAALKVLADTFRRSLRETDICARIGGEEFAALLAQTDSGQSREIAERLRKALAKTSVALDDGAKLKFTVSLGFSSNSADERDIDELIKRAERSLREGRRAGHNPA